MCGAEMVLAASFRVIRNGTGLSCQNESNSKSVNDPMKMCFMASATSFSRGRPLLRSLSKRSSMGFIGSPIHRLLHHQSFEHIASAVSLRARGLGVMTSLLQSEDHRFNSGRAHQNSVISACERVKKGEASEGSWSKRLLRSPRG